MATELPSGYRTTATGEYYNDGYSFRSHMCPAMGVGYNPAKQPIDWEALRRTIECWRLAAPNYYGDYYPLTEYSPADDAWMAWQYDRPDLGQGMVQAFRRLSCKEETMLFKLHGLNVELGYEVKDVDQERTMRISGRELTEKGLLVKPPASSGGRDLLQEYSGIIRNNFARFFHFTPQAVSDTRLATRDSNLDDNLPSKQTENRQAYYLKARPHRLANPAPALPCGIVNYRVLY